MEVVTRGKHHAPYKLKAHYERLKDTKVKTGKNRRPCIVLPGRIGDSEPGTICLMATFEGVGANSLPQIYQDFIVPVFPNTGDDKFGTPLQTCPQWGAEAEQWIITVPIVPKTGRPLELPRWRSTEVCSGVHLGKEGLYKLVGACRERRLEWERKVQSRKNALACFTEMQVRVPRASLCPLTTHTYSRD
ncbi:hypothetical protein DFH09DRAFT_934843 [Mycena vulgaris]|nr:hypothetical protein DFH09DRAFT_934843 [Mycena vulgaris]